MMVVEPLMLIVDGVTGSWQRTRQVLSKALSLILGRVSYRGATSIDPLANIAVDVRESSWRSARVNFDVRLGDLISGEDGSGTPVIADRSLKVSADVYTGGVYLVGALREGNGNVGAAGALECGDHRFADSTDVVVFARVARIQGGLLPDVGSEVKAQGRGAPVRAPADSQPGPISKPALVPGPELPPVEPVSPSENEISGS